jgi:hypothetical protein
MICISFVEELFRGLREAIASALEALAARNTVISETGLFCPGCRNPYPNCDMRWSVNLGHFKQRLDRAQMICLL